MSVRSAKDAIREARSAAGLTQEQMSEGICTIQALSRIETGAAGVSPATFQALMERAGAPCERYPIFASRSDFDCFYALKLARFHLDAWQLAPAWEELEKLETYGWADNKLYYQEWLLLHGRLQFLSYQCDHARNYHVLLNALHISRPDIDLFDFRALLLSQNEIQILTALAQEALYLGQRDTCLAIHTQIEAYLADSKFSSLEKERMQAEDAVVYAKYLLGTGDCLSAVETTDRYRSATALYWNLSLLLELTFLMGLGLHHLGDTPKAAEHIKNVFYTAHAVKSNYANVCREHLSRHTDFPVSDYMRQMPEIDSKTYPVKEIMDTGHFSNGIFNADSPDIYTLGMLLHDLRTEQNLSMDIVCHGLCGKSKLSKIENGSLQPDIALTEALLQRLGISERIFTFWGNERESRLNDLKFQLIHIQNLSSKMQENYFQEMERLVDEKDVLYYQDFLVVKALKNRSPSHRISGLKKALHYTLPDFDIHEIMTCRLSWEELSILNCLADAYRKTDDSYLCSLYYHQITAYIAKVCPSIMLQAQVYPHTLKAYCHTLYIQRQYNAVLELQKQFCKAFNLMCYNIDTYGSYLFYYCQALGECMQFDAATLYAVYCCRAKGLMNQDSSAAILKRAFEANFNILLED